MLTYQATAPGQGAFVEVGTPVPKGDEILVRVRYCGVCGTDYALSSGNSSFIRNKQATYPIRLGHEWSGVVAAVGPDVRGFEIGDPVVGDNYVSCGVCPACQKKDYNGCTGRHHVGTIDPCWPGAFAEYYLAPVRHVYKLAPNVSLKEAAFCEPLSVAWGGVKKMHMDENSVVCVIGTGSIAMAAAALSRYRGAGQVYVIGRNAFKLEKALSLGITGTIDTSSSDPVKTLLGLTGGRYADCILECSGAPSTIGQCLDLAAQNATVALIGFYETYVDGLNVDTLVSKQLTLIGIMGEYGNLETVSKIMAGFDLRMSGIVTATLPFSRMDEALKPADPRRVIKTMVEFPEK